MLIGGVEFSVVCGGGGKIRSHKTQAAFKAAILSPSGEFWKRYLYELGWQSPGLDLMSSGDMHQMFISYQSRSGGGHTRLFCVLC